MESQTQYTRYICHEIRTPLNAAFLGLKVLLDEFKNRQNAGDIDCYDTLTDVNTSCVIAIDTLNDLLLLEKFKSGDLKLQKVKHLYLLLFMDV